MLAGSGVLSPKVPLAVTRYLLGAHPVWRGLAKAAPPFAKSTGLRLSGVLFGIRHMWEMPNAIDF